MKKKEHLFSLVKSLDRHEKKHFRLFTSTVGGEKKYLRLFDVISSMKSYDEKIVRKKLAGEKFLKQLPVAKNYLSFLVMKFLRQYHSGSSVENQLSEAIKNIEILYARGLYENARSVLARAEKVAHDNEKFLRHLEIINWKRKLDRIVGYHLLDEKKIMEEEKMEAELVEKYQNMKEYDNLSDHFFVLAARTNFPSGSDRKQRLDRLAKNKLLMNNEYALSYKARYVFNLVNARLYHTSGNLEKSYWFGKQQIQAIESLPSLSFNEERYNYIIALYNQLIILNFLKKNDEFEATLGKIRSLAIRNNKEGITVFYAYLPELDFSLVNKKFGRVYELEKEILIGLKKFANGLNKQVELGLYYSLACLFFWSGNPKRALHWLNRILNNPELDIRTDIYCAARLVNLVFHFELKNYDLLSSLARSADRYLKKKDFFGELEDILLHYFGVLIPSASSGRVRKRILGNLAVEILDFSRKKENLAVFSMFDFLQWAIKKAEK